MADTSNVVVSNLGHGAYRISTGDRQQLAWATGPASARWVYFDGRVYVLTTAALQTTGVRVTHDEMALASPMPATVITVKVAPGDTVAQGDVLIVLEAMKMELPIVAPRAGRVRSVACTPGELVQPGVALVDLE